MKDLYLLVDGTHANPDDCDVGADNELRHGENGVPVALNEDGSPQTVAQGAIDNMNVQAAEAGEVAAAEAEAIIAEDTAHREAGAKPEVPVSDEKPSDADLLLTTDDVQPKPAKAAPKPKKAQAKKPVHKNREIKAH